MLILRNQAHFIIKKSKISIEKSPMLPQKGDTDLVKDQKIRMRWGVRLGSLLRIF